MTAGKSSRCNSNVVLSSVNSSPPSGDCFPAILELAVRHEDGFPGNPAYSDAERHSLRRATTGSMMVAR